MSVGSRTRLTVGSHVSSLVPYSPGKPIEEVKRELGIDNVIKLASNENGLGPSPLAIAAMREAAERVHLYPDGACYELREALADRLDVPRNHLVFGAGSDEIIHFLGLALLEPGDEMIQGDPSFVRYEAAAILNRAVCHKVPLRDWTHDLDAMAKRITSHTRLIFIASPNNPTGTISRRNELETFLDRVPDRAVVVLDEAYYEYVDSAKYPDSVAYVREGRRLISLRTFSKAYGLAGLRVGYGIAPPDVIGVIEQVREPFNVSLIAQAAAAAAINDTQHVEATRANNRVGKSAFYAGFDRLELPYAPSEGNFVWVDVRRDCCEVFRNLLRRGVIVRTGDIFGAPTHLRVTIGTPSENARFLSALEEAIQP